MVRFEPCLAGYARMEIVSLHSIMVRFERPRTANPEQGNTSLHSIMVRFEHFTAKKQRRLLSVYIPLW